MPVNIDDMLPLIDRVAKYVAADYPDIYEDDMRQHLCLFIMQNGKSIRSKEEGGNPHWILRRVAHTFARTERTQQLATSMQYTYRLSDVQQILETAFDIEDLQNTFVPEDAMSFSGNDAIEIGSDVRAALDRLSKADRIALFKRYALKEIPDNSSYDRKKLNVATKNLVFQLNSYRGRGSYIGKRRVISNATAQAIVSSDW